MDLEDLECRQELTEVLGLKNVSHEGLSRHHCVDWLNAHEAHFSKARTMETADLTGIPLKSIMGPINYRPLKQFGSPGLIVEAPKHRTSIARIRVATPAQLRVVENAMPLTFFYPENEGKKTSPQAYVKEAVKRQQELNELCRRNMAQAQMRQRKKYDEKILQAKPYAVAQYVWVFQNIIPPKGKKKLLKKWRGPFMITGVHQQGRFYRLSTGRAAHYENLKPHARTII